ncbi:MAG: saccharopine dehydrogenase C-terminal domain-containing protein [Rhodothermales bacterium]|nr:saccharopine dehydrogenase C-terminal domain-containing protein [Rhodothermales bacterium]
MKITVLGAGAIGSAIACDLAERDAVTHVQVVDAKASARTALSDTVKSPKLRTVRADVRDERALSPILARSTSVVSCVMPSLNPKLSALALRADAHFCDMGGDSATFYRERALADEAEEHGRWVVPNCGLAPGLVNVLVMEGMDRFEEVDAVVMRVGNIPLESSAPFFHRLTYSAKKLVEDYTAPVPIIRDGKLETVEPLTGIEEVRFPKPFGRLEAFYTGGKLSTLPEDLTGRVRTLDYKTLRHRGHAEGMRTVFALGFAEDRHIDVRTHLTYRDLLVRRFRQHLGGEFEDAVLVRIRIEGTREGRRDALVYELLERHDRESGFSAMQRCSGFSTAIIAHLLTTGQVPGGGVAPPEQIIPREPFFEALAERGVDIQERWEPAEAAQPAAPAEA